MQEEFDAVDRVGGASRDELGLTCVASEVWRRPVVKLEDTIRTEGTRTI